MREFLFLSLLTVILATGCNGASDFRSHSELAIAGVELAPALGGLEFSKPIDLVFPVGSSETGYIVEQSGRVLSVTLNDGAWTAREFLNIEGRVNDRGREEGLLGLALSPNFDSESYIYVNYTAASPRRTVVSRFSVDQVDEVVADPASENVILEVAQPYSNHNGGHLQFGPDGFLYVGFGDGGAAGDPRGNGQNLGTLLGTIVRIDVTDLDSVGTYTIPDGNPFVGVEGARSEVWAFGLRNPWRFSFDRLTGDLWAADVGQNEREEVNVIHPGLNYGWNVMEGSLCYGRDEQQCSRDGLELPLTEYGRDGGCSVTGGYIYRGERIPVLHGLYVFGDFCSGKIWSYSPDTDLTEVLIDTSLKISTFSQDHEGELYVVSLDGGVYALVYSEDVQ